MRVGARFRKEWHNKCSASNHEHERSRRLFPTIPFFDGIAVVAGTGS